MSNTRDPDGASLEDHVRGVGGDATRLSVLRRPIEPEPDADTIESVIAWTAALRTASGDQGATIKRSPSTLWPGMSWIAWARGPMSNSRREVARGNTPQAVALRFEAVHGARWRAARAAKAAREAKS